MPRTIEQIHRTPDTRRVPPETQEILLVIEGIYKLVKLTLRLSPNSEETLFQALGKLGIQRNSGGTLDIRQKMTFKHLLSLKAKVKRWSVEVWRTLLNPDTKIALPKGVVTVITVYDNKVLVMWETGAYREYEIEHVLTHGKIIQ